MKYPSSIDELVKINYLLKRLLTLHVSTQVFDIQEEKETTLKIHQTLSCCCLNDVKKKGKEYTFHCRTIDKRSRVEKKAI